VVEESEAKRMGLLKIDPLSHVVDFFEKPSDQKTLDAFALPSQKGHPQQYLGSMGIYIFKKEALCALLQQEGDDFGKHTIPNQVKKGKTSAYIYHGYWEDIGTIAAYYQANLALTSGPNWMQAYNETHQLYTPHYNNIPTPLIKEGLITSSLINQGTLIEAKEITHSIIGLKTWIKKNSILRDCITVGENSSEYSIIVGENCVIQKAIIDSNVIIGNNVQMTNPANLQKYDGDGVFIRDGVTIVTSGARLPDGFTL
jgi:glucose-1-phosphate adenylyltransferase